ncbi:MAG: GNAT family N-acetyltransferase [Pseudomonadota bacterium]
MTSDTDLAFREATEDDVPGIIALLADDFLGHTRESESDGTPAAYGAAFLAIQESLHNFLFVATQNGTIVGTFQLTLIPGLSFKGGLRAQIEAVRVAADRRGGGIGGRMIRFAIDRARAEGCVMVQLTMNKQRTETLRFYESLGFNATHEGFKLMLPMPQGV